MSKKPEFKSLILTNFTADIFVSALKSLSSETLSVQGFQLGFDQVMAALSDPQHSVWEKDFDSVFCWIQPETFFMPFQRFLMCEPESDQKILSQLDHLCSLLINISSHKKVVFPLFFRSDARQGGGRAAVATVYSLSRLYILMNAKLIERLSGHVNIFLIDTPFVLQSVQPLSSPKLWYMAKVPFTESVFRSMAQEFYRLYHLVYGERKKVIALDLDHTLWGGVVGDEGWENLRLGGHDFVGEAYRDFQQHLLYLKHRGYLLVIVSKNSADVALDAIRNHPEMVLKEDDFVATQINWQDKADNLINIAQTLNVGLDSFVFIDDNPVERAQVQQLLPEVFVPDWPKDPMLFVDTLQSLPCLDQLHVTEEDKQRHDMYQANEKRAVFQTSATRDDWLMGLKTTVSLSLLLPENLERVHQLFNKTNQMNLTTRRMDKQALFQYFSQEGYRMITLSVSDAFGSSGLVGLIGVVKQGDILDIQDFLLSCRVMGREIEAIMLYICGVQAQRLGCSRIQACYQKTEKNEPCFSFFKSHQQDYNKTKNVFSWDVDTLLSYLKTHITLEGLDGL